MAEDRSRRAAPKKKPAATDDGRRRALDLDAAKQRKKSAQARFYRELEKYMRSSGRNATGQDVLQAAEQIWHASEVVRKLQPPPTPHPGPDLRDRPVPRPGPRRVSDVVSGGLPGQKRRK